MLRYSIPLIPNNIAWWITNVSNRTIIASFLGTFYNGLFAVSSKIPTILSILFNVFNLTFQQTAIESINEDMSYKYFSNLLRRTIIALTSFCVVIGALCPFLYDFLISKKYIGGLVSIPLLLAGSLLLCLAQYLGGIMIVQKSTKIIGLSTMIAALINVVINIALIQVLGLNAEGFAAFVGYLFMFGERFFVLRNRLDSKSILLTLVLCLTIYFILFYYFINVYNNSLFYILSLVICISSSLFLNKSIVERFFYSMILMIAYSRNFCFIILYTYYLYRGQLDGDEL